ncbi:MAG: EamA family transporter RarD [Bacteriovoracaceae bacterium]|nr:EamA family transporter RarD [Bacteriovoracaceae bacterium]
MSEGSKALLAAIIAFSGWGLFPIYWKFFPELSGESLFMQRLFWSLLTLMIIIPLTGKFSTLKEILKDNRKWWLMLSAIFIASNWLAYIYAVTSGHIIEASMGYFLNPLINVLVGWLFLKEKLRKLQWPAVLLALTGVVWIALTAGLEGVPWLALFLSITFAFYGLIRKVTHVGSLEGLGFETAIVFIPFLLWWFFRGGNLSSDLHALGWKQWILALSGVITCLPLVLFAYSTRRLKLQTLGFTQYLSPSLKFICGWAIFKEQISVERWQGFMFIWAALIWYTLEGILRSKHFKKSQ